ncbi:MAG: beta-galactosidase [Armatimonadetes bacterium]|nr:beta-galactosidase [Armatimonadota bacterium]
MRFGADYYPEHWPEERWETDARMMKEAGFNITRLAEFAWVKMEPREGEFDFDWLLRAINILNDHGIQSVIGTPTATPPAWLCINKPSVMRVNEQRQQITFGNRQQSCINQPEYLEACDHIIEALADAMDGNDGVYGWQIDNEFWAPCYCDECQKLFQKWLQEKYGTLQALEAAWGAIFWSQTYTDWRQIPLPWATSGAPNPSLALDYRRFISDSYESFTKRQIKLIRQYSDKPITHNFMGISPDEINYQQIADHLDFASWDNYPFGSADPAMIAAGHDITRGYLRKNFWMMEQMSGPGGWGEMSASPRPGRIREWTYQAIARGADAMIYFRWRVCRSGTEQYWHGILNHDGATNRRYSEIKRTRDELLKFEDLLEGTTVKAEVAFLNDYDSRFAFRYQKSNSELSYVKTLVSLYKGFFENNIAVDILTKDADLSGYKVVVAPAHFVLTKKRAALLKDYVQNGGTLVMTYRSAVKDATGLIFDEPLPGLLQDVFGVVVKEYHSPEASEENMIWGSMGEINGHTSRVNVWLDLLELRGAEVMAKYDGGFISYGVAITRNSFGKGKAYYIGTQPESDFMITLMDAVAKDAGVTLGIPTPQDVEACERVGEGKKLTFIINHTEQTQNVSIPEPCTNLITCEAIEKSLTIDAYGVAVLK